MIIISESKSEHYLIKNFLIEARKREDQYVGVYNVVKDLNDPDFKTAIDNPKFSGEFIYDEEKEKQNVQKKYRRSYKPASGFDIEIHDGNRPVTSNEINTLIDEDPSYKSFFDKLKSKGMVLTLSAGALLFAASQFSKKEPADNSGTQKSTISQELKKDSESNNLRIQAVKKIADDNNLTNKKQKIDIYKALKFTDDELDLQKAKKERRYAGPGIDSSDENSLYRFESASWNDRVAKPYPDAGGTSIGYGTQLFMDAKDGEKTPWQKVFFEDKLGNKPTGNPKTVRRDGKIVKISDIKKITEKEARIAADQDLEEREEDVDSEYPWLSSLPRDAQLAFIDMTYNMGIYFDMENFKGNMKEAAQALKEVQNIDGDDFYEDDDKSIMIAKLENATKYLKSAKEELKYLKPLEQIEYEGSKEKLMHSAYATMSSSAKPADSSSMHPRALNSLQRIDDAISMINNKIESLNESKVNKSLKLVYENLFV